MWLFSMLAVTAAHGKLGVALSLSVWSNEIVVTTQMTEKQGEKFTGFYERQVEMEEYD